jgi:pre-mRNA-processing factor 8
VVQTLSSYEQAQFQSKSDWRKRALQASTLHLRTARFQVPPENLTDSLTYVIPLNLLKKFVEISDPYVQICAVMYGIEVDEAIEIHCFVIPPQTGTYESVDFVKRTPVNPALDGLRCFGLIHTTALDEKIMSPQEAISCGAFCDVNDKAYSQFANVVLAYLPGAVAVRGFELSAQGFEWALQNKDTRDRALGWDEAFFIRIPILITEVFQGWFMVPESVDWNLNFKSLQIAEVKSYDVELGNPKPFYDPEFRPNHFLQFVGELRAGDEGAIDVENNYL